MTVKEHYDNHLGNFYSWYCGDFIKNKNEFKSFCIYNSVNPINSGIAIDLGAGNGIQSVALAELGFKVKAIDFNHQLIAELRSKIGKNSIEVFHDDIRKIKDFSKPQPELIVCCGDTLSHLESTSEIEELLERSYNILSPGGKVILTFRDYSFELTDTNRFIPVKSDSRRILTCVIECFPEKVRVTDLLHELENDKWVQKISSYFKVRISRNTVVSFLENIGFRIEMDLLANRIVTIIAKK